MNRIAVGQSGRGQKAQKGIICYNSSDRLMGLNKIDNKW